MRTGAAEVLLLIFAVSMFSMLSGCTGQTSGTFDVQRDHKAISLIVDAAVLSDNPPREFRKALTQVRSFSSVDSAWTDGVTFFVKYKNGGTVSWTAPPEPTIQDHNTRGAAR